MNTQPIWRGIQKGRDAVVRNCPKIFAGIAIVGTVTTAVLAVRGTPKAMELLEEKKKELDRPVLTKKETIRTAWKCYIPAAASGILTIASIAAGNSVWAARNAELAVAYGVSQTMMRLYSQRVAQEVGPEKAVQMKAEIINAQCERFQTETQEPEPKKIFFFDKSGASMAETYEIVDYLSGNKFHGSVDDIRRAVDEFNETVLKANGKGCLNDLYSCFHTPELPDTGAGNLLGWSYGDNCKEVIPMITSELVMPDGYTRLILDFYNPPQYEY